MARLATVEKGQWNQFERLLDARMFAEELVALNQNPDVLDEMLALMRQRLFGISPTQTLAALIKAAGFRRRNVNPDITEEHFPLVGPVADVSVMRALSQEELGGNGLTTVEYEAAIDHLGYRPATLAEQLAWAKETWNGRDTVVALGSSWSSLVHRNVPCLYAVGGQRQLRLYFDDPGDRWLGDYRFLVVRK
jgi:hypothetical protein